MNSSPGPTGHQVGVDKREDKRESPGGYGVDRAAAASAWASAALAFHMALA